MTTLPRQTLGRTGVEVTTLGYGAMELRGAPAGPPITDEQAEQVLNAVLDAGINIIDTSPDYADAASERAIASARRCQLAVSSPSRRRPAAVRR